jgi:hypothetical protein
MAEQAKRSTIFSVGYEFPGGVADSVDLESTRSLLDADIVVFESGIPHEFHKETFQGKPSLTEESSFKAKEALAHWRSEITAALEAGKLIVVFLASPQEVFAHTGERQFDGKGRNARITTVVDRLTSYEAVPIEAVIRAASGRGISAAGPLKYLATYWKEFGTDSLYEAFLESGTFTDVLLHTQAGARVVGASVLKGPGALLLLPPLRYDYKTFVRKRQDGREEWTKDALGYGKRLAAALAGIAAALRSDVDVTPPPTWASAESYRLDEEALIEAAILDRTRLLAELQTERQELKRKLADASDLRDLLYETGKPLERAILKALRLMGFLAEAFVDGKSEFDAVFTSAEGRFLGEAEGRDNRPLSIDKFSQLERNLAENFARDEVTEHAKGVLFGNGYRLTRPEDRPEEFTEKCVAGARRLGVALVRTRDLFEPARYLRRTADQAYADACRRALFDASGCTVRFPEPPSSNGAATGEVLEKC